MTIALIKILFSVIDLSIENAFRLFHCAYLLLGEGVKSKKVLLVALSSEIV